MLIEFPALREATDGSGLVYEAPVTVVLSDIVAIEMVDDALSSLYTQHMTININMKYDDAMRYWVKGIDVSKSGDQDVFIRCKKKSS